MGIHDILERTRTYMKERTNGYRDCVYRKIMDGQDIGSYLQLFLEWTDREEMKRVHDYVEKHRLGQSKPENIDRLYRRFLSNTGIEDDIVYKAFLLQSLRTAQECRTRFGMQREDEQAVEPESTARYQEDESKGLREWLRVRRKSSPLFKDPKCYQHLVEMGVYFGTCEQDTISTRYTIYKPRKITSVKKLPVVGCADRDEMPSKHYQKLMRINVLDELLNKGWVEISCYRHAHDGGINTGARGLNLARDTARGIRLLLSEHGVKGSVQIKTNSSNAIVEMDERTYRELMSLVSRIRQEEQVDAKK